MIENQFFNFDHREAKKVQEDKTDDVDRITRHLTILEKNKKKEVKQKKKKFTNMNQEEKKERIKYLWGVARRYVNQLKFIRVTKSEMDGDFLKEFA